MQDGCSNVQFAHLSLKGTRHQPLTQSFDAVHLGFHQAAPVIPDPTFPDTSPQPSTCSNRRISMHKGFAFAYSSILARRNNGNTSSLDDFFMDCLRCRKRHRPLGSPAPHRRAMAAAHPASLALLDVTQIALICSVWGSMPMCNLRHCRRRSGPCFLHFHSPSPKNLIPVESTSKCSPAWLRVYGTCTFKSSWRRHSVLKLGTGQARPFSCRTDCTKPVVCLSAKPNRFLSVKHN